MKLIIDIPEETYNDIQSRDWKNGKLVFSEEWIAIHNGTPLPKGHGRLIDADKFISEHFGEIARLVDDAPTVQAVPVEVLQEIRHEIDKWHHLTDKAFNDGIDTALEIIDKHIKEIEGSDTE